MNTGKIERDTINNPQHILSILNFLRLSKKDGKSRDVAILIDRIEDVELLESINFDDKYKKTREIIYKELFHSIKKSLDKQEFLYYKELIGKISILPPEICEKILNITSLNVFKEMSLENKQDATKTLLKEENYPSLDYISKQYLVKEEEYLKYQDYLELVKNEAKNMQIKECNPNDKVELRTIYDLLCRDYDVEKVLTGFNDDEEITEKTLVRSLEYKNN